MATKTFGTRKKSTSVLSLFRATWVMTVRHDGFAADAEGAQQEIVMWQEGSK